MARLNLSFQGDEASFNVKDARYVINCVIVEKCRILFSRTKVLKGLLHGLDVLHPLIRQWGLDQQVS